MNIPAWIAGMPGRQKTAGKMLAGFFALMLIFTYVSRGIDSFLVPTVSTVRVGEGSLTRMISLRGAVQPSSVVALEVPAGFLVKRVFVKDGNWVAAGDALAELNVDAVEEQLTALHRELESKRLDWELSQLRAELPADDPFHDAQLKLQRSEEDWEQTQSIDGETISRASSNLSRARRELRELRDDSDYEDAEMEAQRQHILELQWALDDAIQKAESNQITATRAIEDAKEGLEKVQRTQDAQSAEKHASEKVQALQGRKVQLSIVQYQEEIQKLEALLESGGKIYASEAGTIMQSNLSPGSITSLGGAFILGEQDQWGVFIGKVGEEDGQNLSIGAQATIRLRDQREIAATISGLTPPTETEEQYIVAARIDAADVLPGITGTMNVQIRGNTSGQLLPLSAIHSDGPNPARGYVFVLREKNTTMGVQTVVEKLPVDILEHDALTAVVNGVFTKEDRIVSASSRSLSPNNRVRLEGFA